MSTDDPVTGFITAARARLAAAFTYEDYRAMAGDLGKALDALADARVLHCRPEKPARCWDLDLRCARHYVTTDPIPPFSVIRDCPDCTYRERWYCAHCREEEWPCPTLRVITAALTGEVADD